MDSYLKPVLILHLIIFFPLFFFIRQQEEVIAFFILEAARQRTRSNVGTYMDFLFLTRIPKRLHTIPSSCVALKVSLTPSCSLRALSCRDHLTLCDDARAGGKC